MINDKKINDKISVNKSSTFFGNNKKKTKNNKR